MVANGRHGEGDDRSEGDSDKQRSSLAGPPSLQTPPLTSNPNHFPSSTLQFLVVSSADAAHSEGNDYGSTITGKTVERESKYQRRSPATPTLSVDTRTMSWQDNVKEQRRPSLTSVSPEAPPQLSSPLPPLRSAPPSRNPDWQILLTRATPVRHIDGQPEAIESQPMTASARQQSIADNGSKNSEAKITILPVLETSGELGMCPQSTRKHYESALPHYETWIKNKVTRSGMLSRLRAVKESIRKKILRIQEIPPSNDGRHIDVDRNRRQPLIDERTGREYIKNAVTSSRYTLYNFIPRQLFAQFSKLANFYFLCVSLLQMIPGLSTTGQYTTIVPLAFFVIISMAKEGYDDLRRYRLDKAENRKTTLVLSDRKASATSTDNVNSGTSTPAERQLWVKIKWEDIGVGDVVKLARDEAAPADLAVLHTSGPEGIAYVETMALDGETNLKSKRTLPQLARSCVEGIASCKAHIVVEDPNIDLYKFEGKVTVENETLPLANSEIIYRGSVLRNTSEAIGIVVYTGQETKIRMNATKNPRIKAPALQNEVNKVVVMLVVFVVVLAIFNSVAYQIWQGTIEEKAWYLTNAGVAFFPILASFIILFNTMIPLSLYVSLEIVKLFQMLLMDDVEMYDETSNTPMEARTSTINEELGQVNYIFSDKTGTLTNNSMKFRKMSIAGTAWLHSLDLQEEAVNEATHKSAVEQRRSKGKKPMRRGFSMSTSAEASAAQGTSSSSCGTPVFHESSTRPRLEPSFRVYASKTELDTVQLLQYIRYRPNTQFARKVRFFLLSIVLCHTCHPEKKRDGAIHYQAASPDEQALVRAAQDLGYIMTDRQNSAVTVQTFPGDGDEPTLETYQILDVIEFSSTRKRMSVIVRMPDLRICVFCKGADSTLIRLLRLSGLAIAKVVEIEQRVSTRRSLEAHEALRRASEAKSRKDSMTRKSMSIHRPSLSGLTTAQRLQPIRDEVNEWLANREIDVDMSTVDNSSIYYSPRPSEVAFTGKKAKTDTTLPSHGPITLDEARHVSLSEVSSPVNLLPREYTTIPILSLDPLQPPDSVLSYNLAPSAYPQGAAYTTPFEVANSVNTPSKEDTLNPQSSEDNQREVRDAQELRGLQGFFRRFIPWIGSGRIPEQIDTDRDATHYGQAQCVASLDKRLSFQGDDAGELVEEGLVVDDAAVLERCFQHINDFATEGLRTLLYAHRYLEEDEYGSWKKLYLDASTSLVNRHELIERAGAQVERDLELGGATAIEDKLQKGVPEAIEKLRRAKIKLWMLTGDKRETAMNIGLSCRLIKDYSSITVLDREIGEVSHRIAAATIDINNGHVAHSVVVVDGLTLSQIDASEHLHKLFVSLAISVDTVICCRASPSQKASLVSSIRHKVHNAITLAIGDGANDIAMIQEAHVGIGITGKEGLQAARTSDYSIAQFRFLTKLLLVHGRWNYIRTCKYTLGTFWKEMLFYLTQALYQRFAGYTGTSLYESWSLSLFNTLFTSLPVIFMGIFEQDLSASTLMAVPELYHSLGHRNDGFNIKIYLAWVAMAASQAVIVFFIMLGLFGQTIFTTDNGLYAMGALTFTACILIIATKMQFWELHNKTYMCAISMFVSVGGWFLWMIILSTTYRNNVIYDVREGFLERFGRNALWWLTLFLILAACWVLELGVKTAQRSWYPNDADCFRELEKDSTIKKRFEQAAAIDSTTGSNVDPAEANGISFEERGKRFINGRAKSWLPTVKTVGPEA